MTPAALTDTAALRELLLARSHISGNPEQWSLQPFTSNTDRRDAQARRRFVLSHPGAPPSLVTVDSFGSDLAQRSESFYRAYPALAAPILFQSSRDGIHIVAYELFDGVPIDLAVENAILTAPEAVALLQETHEALNRTSKPARPQARRTELAELASRLADIPDLEPFDLRFLLDDALPALEAACADLPARSRWTSGDFIARNILVSRDRRVRIIDYEFARLTSIPEEDWFRLVLMQHSSPALAQAIRAVPFEEPGWLHLYFWLRQLSLEASVNNHRLFAASLPGLLNCIRSARTLIQSPQVSGSRVPESLRPLTRALRSFFPRSTLPSSLRDHPEA